MTSEIIKLAEEKDIFDTGNLVIHKESKFICITTCTDISTDHFMFEGIIIYNKNTNLLDNLGRYYKTAFEQFRGTIQLQQD